MKCQEKTKQNKNENENENKKLILIYIDTTITKKPKRKKKRKQKKEKLLEYKLIVVSFIAAGQTPLHDAAIESTPPMAELLVRYGAKVNAIDYGGRTPLHCAIQKGQGKEHVQKLLDLGADPNIADNEGYTSLHYSVKGTPDIVELLVRRGAVVDARDNFGRTPLFLAGVIKNSNNVAIVKTLVALGADPNTTDSNNLPPIAVAAINNNLGLVKALAEVGTNNEAMLEAMHEAARVGATEIVQLLASLGVSVNQCSTTRQPPLFRAIAEGHMETTMKLIELGAKDKLDAEGMCGMV
jgi:ankyrin repeat protein